MFSTSPEQTEMHFHKCNLSIFDSYFKPLSGEKAPPVCSGEVENIRELRLLLLNQFTDIRNDLIRKIIRSRF